MNNIEEIKKVFLPNCRDVKFAQIDLDINDLGISDILRNINRFFPKNNRMRQYICNGDMAIIIKCKSEYLYPMDGLVIIITNDDKIANITARNHIVVVVSMNRINDDDISEITKDLLSYIAKEFKNSLDDVTTFCVKYVYDMDMENDEV